MTINSLAKATGRNVSPVSVAKATTPQIAKVDKVLARHGDVPKLDYAPQWYGRAIAGAISTRALFRMVAGDSEKAHTQAMASGVWRWGNDKLRKRHNAPNAPQPLGRFEGMDDVNTFLNANNKEQDAYLKEAGVIA